MSCEYRYISLQTGGGFFMDNSAVSHRDIIDEQAAQGWRYVGYIPIAFTSYGGVKEIDLIFERPRQA